MTRPAGRNPALLTGAARALGGDPREWSRYNAEQQKEQARQMAEQQKAADAQAKEQAKAAEKQAAQGQFVGILSRGQQPDKDMVSGNYVPKLDARTGQPEVRAYSSDVTGPDGKPLAKITGDMQRGMTVERPKPPAITRNTLDPADFRLYRGEDIIEPEQALRDAEPNVQRHGAAAIRDRRAAEYAAKLDGLREQLDAMDAVSKTEETEARGTVEALTNYPDDSEAGRKRLADAQAVIERADARRKFAEEIRGVTKQRDELRRTPLDTLLPVFLNETADRAEQDYRTAAATSQADIDAEYSALDSRVAAINERAAAWRAKNEAGIPEGDFEQHAREAAAIQEELDAAAALEKDINARRDKVSSADTRLRAEAAQRGETVEEAKARMQQAAGAVAGMVGKLPGDTAAMAPAGGEEKPQPAAGEALTKPTKAQAKDISPGADSRGSYKLRLADMEGANDVWLPAGMTANVSANLEQRGEGVQEVTEITGLAGDVPVPLESARKAGESRLSRVETLVKDFRDGQQAALETALAAAQVNRDSIMGQGVPEGQRTAANLLIQPGKGFWSNVADAVNYTAAKSASMAGQVDEAGKAIIGAALEAHLAENKERLGAISAQLPELRAAAFKGLVPMNRVVEAYKAVGVHVEDIPTAEEYAAKSIQGGIDYDIESQSLIAQEDRMKRLEEYGRLYGDQPFFDAEGYEALVGQQMNRVKGERNRLLPVGEKARIMWDNAWDRYKEGMNMIRTAYNVATNDIPDAQEAMKAAQRWREIAGERGEVGGSDRDSWFGVKGANTVVSMLPDVFETIATTTAAAAIGSIAGPGGTAAGGASGIFGKSALKKLVMRQAKMLVGKGMPKEAAEKAAVKQVSAILAKEAAEKTGEKLMTRALKAEGAAMFAKVGAFASSLRGNGAEMLNGTLGQMSPEELASNPDKARRAVMLAAVLSMPAAMLDAADGVESGIFRRTFGKSPAGIRGGFQAAAGNWARQLGMSTLKEGGTGFVQGLLGIVNKRMFNGEKPFALLTKEEQAELADNTIGEAFGGFAFETAGGLANLRRAGSMVKGWKAADAAAAATKKAENMASTKGAATLLGDLPGWDAVLMKSPDAVTFGKMAEELTAKAQEAANAGNTERVAELNREIAGVQQDRARKIEAEAGILRAIATEAAAVSPETSLTAQTLARVMYYDDPAGFSEAELASIGYARQEGGIVPADGATPLMEYLPATGRWLVPQAVRDQVASQVPSFAKLNAVPESVSRTIETMIAGAGGGKAAATPAPAAKAPAEKPAKEPKPAKAPEAPAAELPQFAVSLEGVADPVVVRAKDAADAEAVAKKKHKGKKVTGVAPFDIVDEAAGAAAPPADTISPQPGTPGTQSEPAAGTSNGLPPQPGGAQTPTATAAGTGEKTPTTPAGESSQPPGTLSKPGRWEDSAREQTGAALLPKDKRVELERAIAAVRPFLPDYGPQFSDVRWSMEADESGGFTLDPGTGILHISVPKLLKTMGRTKESGKWILAGLNEELIHLWSLRMEASGELDAKGIVERVKKENPGVWAAFQKAYPRASDEYAPHEFMRMVVQGRIRMESGGVVVDRETTEEQFSDDILRAIRQYLSKLVSAIRKLATSFKPETAEALAAAADDIIATMKANWRTGETSPAAETGPPASAGGATVDAPANEAATSPENDKPQPTDAQKEAGNYAKGHVRFGGMDISIENPAGSERTGTDKGGKAWSITMRDHYGYIRGTEGKDGDHLDIFINPGTPLDYNGPVWVVNQRKPDGTFDEHKAVAGIEAEREDNGMPSYARNYTADFLSRQSSAFTLAISGRKDPAPRMVKFATMADFRAWVEAADLSKPATLPEKPKVNAPPERRKAIGKGVSGEAAYAEFQSVLDADAFTYTADLKRLTDPRGNFSEAKRQEIAQSAKSKLARIREKTGLQEQKLRELLNAYHAAVREVAKSVRSGDTFTPVTFDEFVASATVPEKPKAEESVSAAGTAPQDVTSLMGRPVKFVADRMTEGNIAVRVYRATDDSGKGFVHAVDTDSGNNVQLHEYPTMQAAMLAAGAYRAPEPEQAAVPTVEEPEVANPEAFPDIENLEAGTKLYSDLFQAEAKKQIEDQAQRGTPYSDEAIAKTLAEWSPEATRPRVAKFLREIDAKDAAALLRYHNGLYEKFWKLFQWRTGEKVPATQKARAEFLRSFVGEDQWDSAITEANNAKQEAASQRSREQKQRSFEFNKGRAQEYKMTYGGEVMTGAEFVEAEFRNGSRLEKVQVNRSPVKQWAFVRKDDTFVRASQLPDFVIEYAKALQEQQTETAAPGDLPESGGMTVPAEPGAGSSTPVVSLPETDTNAANVKSPQPAALTPEEQAAKDLLDAILNGTIGTQDVGAPQYSRSIPDAAFLPLMQAARALLKSGVNTPAALAASLTKMGGAYLQFSDAMWSAMRASDTSLPASVEWTQVYSALENPAGITESAADEQQLEQRTPSIEAGNTAPVGENPEPVGNEDSGRLGGDREEADAGVGSGGGSGNETPGGGRKGRGNRGRGASTGNESPDGPGDTGGARDSDAPDTGGIAAKNYRITSADDLGSGDLRKKYSDNLAAIKLVKTLQKEGRPATQAEKKVLVKYVGWGGIKGVFNADNKQWGAAHRELKALLTEEEYAAASRSQLDAHYTSEEIITRGVWAAMQRFGFSGGKMYEGGVGVGHFIGLMPDAIRPATHYIGVEQDAITAAIAKYLYPEAKIWHMGFQDAALSVGSADGIVGNPPFGQQSLYDPQFKHLSKFSIHNYFIAKQLELLRPGGVAGFVVSRYFLDALDSTARAHIAKNSEFLGAIRLPNTAFKGNANTEVVTDLVFFKKLPDGQSGETSWVKSSKQKDEATGEEFSLNQWIKDNPNMVMGTPAMTGSQYQENEYTVEPIPGVILGDLLDKAVERLPKSVFEQVDATTAERLTTPEIVEGAGTPRVGGFMVGKDGEIYRRLPDVDMETRYESAGISADATKKKIRGMVEIRDAMNRLVAAEIKDEQADKMEALRKRLNAAYDAFVKEFGPLNKQGNRQAFSRDPEASRILGLERDFDAGVSKDSAKKKGIEPRTPSAKKADIFQKRTNVPYREITHAETAKEALAVSLNQRGMVSLPYMQELTGMDEERILRDLEGIIFRLPEGGFEMRDLYLAGNVRTKLNAAKEAAKENPEFQKNVDALELAQPVPLMPEQISATLGAGWIPEDVYADFVQALIGERPQSLVYLKATGGWAFKLDSDSLAANQTWGVPRTAGSAEEDGSPGKPFGALFSDLLNSKPPTVYITVDKKRLVHQSATAAAIEKTEAIKAKWNEWVFQDTDRRDRLTKIYNEKVNNYADAKFDGSHLEFPGMSSLVELRRHQSDVAWRIITQGSTLLDHVVGAGKTFAGIAAFAEMRRTGRVRKPLFAVPNHLVTQWRDDFIKLYPNANVLYAKPSDFAKDKRKVLFAKIMTGEYDAIIVGHSSLGKIAMDPAGQRELLSEMVAEIIDTIRALQADSSNGRAIAQLERQQESLEQKMKKLADRHRGDDTVTFEELGIDAMFVDEAHEFKNLFYTTQMQRVAGLGNPTGSGKAFDLYLKTRQLRKRFGPKAPVVFATGTPLSNSLVEMFTMQRYLQPDVLEDMGATTLDSWAKLFGDVKQVYEVNPTGTGYRMATRFAEFQNVGDLSAAYKTVADVIAQSDLERQAQERGEKFPIPKVSGGKPKVFAVKRSKEQENYFGVETQLTDSEGNGIFDSEGNPITAYPVGSINWRVDNMPDDPSQDNMLKLTSDARKAGLDMRLINPSLPDDPNSKVNVAVKEMVREYRKWDADKGTQLVFCDLSVPSSARGKAKAKAAAQEASDETAAEEIDDEQQDSTEEISMDELLADSSSFSVYDDVRDKLIAAGIPGNEIAFIHDYDTPEKKSKLFADMNAGRVRILMGSTPKLGAGTNVQERLVALHHLDAPWRPSDLEQREGRIIRQNNKLYERDPEGFEVFIGRYGTELTYDARMWQIIEHKAAGIEGFKRADRSTRTMQDIAGEAANAADMKAATSGNPLIREEIELRGKLEKLLQQQRAWQANQYTIDRDISFYAAEPDRVEAHRKVIAERIAVRDKYDGTEFEMILTPPGGAKKRFVEKSGIAETIAESVRTINGIKGKSWPAIGEYRGFSLGLEIDRDELTVTMAALGVPRWTVTRYSKDDSLSDVGFVQRLDNALNGLDGELVSQDYRIPRAEKKIKDLTEAKSVPFTKAEEIEETRKKHSEIRAALMESKKSAPRKQQGDDRISSFDPGGYLASGITPQQDADYMAAVNAGDMETAQRMVDEAANSKLRFPRDAETGEIIKLQHDTPEDFTVFKPGGYDPAQSGRAIWLGVFGSSLKAGHRVGSRRNPKNRTLSLYADLKNPLVLDSKDMVDFARAAFMDGESDFKKREFPFLISDTVLERIKSDGYDGIIYDRAEDRAEMQKRIDEHVKQSRRLGLSEKTEQLVFDKVEVIAFNPNQIKSAAPVTRDEAGNVIPLSQRFNPGRDEIIFTLDPDALEDAAAEMTAAADELMKAAAAGKPVGDPTRAMSMISEAMQAADTLYVETMPQATRDAWEREGQALMDERGSEAVRAIIMRKAYAGDVLMPAETAAAKILLVRTMGNMRTPDEKLRNLEFAIAYRHTGYSAAASLGSRVDPLMTPAQRIQKWLTGILLAPEEAAARKAADKRKEAAETDDKSEASRLRIEALELELAGAKVAMAKLEADLKKAGFTLHEWLNTAVDIERETPAWNRLTSLMTGWKKDALQKMQGGHIPFKQIAREVGKLESEVRKVRSEFEKQFRDFAEANWRPGMTADELLKLTTPPASKKIATGDIGSDAKEQAIQEALMKMGLIDPDKQGKAKVKRRRSGKRSPLDPDAIVERILRAWRAGGGSKEPSKIVQATREYAKAKDATDEARDALREKLEGLGVSEDLAQELAGMAQERVKAAVLGEMTETIVFMDFEDTEMVVAAAKQDSARRADGLDMLREYWYFSLLSGPTTQVANAANYPAHLLLNSGMTRTIAALLGSTLGAGSNAITTPKLSELGSMWAGLAPGFWDGLRLAVKSWKTGVDFTGIDKMGFDAVTGRTPKTAAEMARKMGVEIPTPAIPGIAGKTARIPMAIMQFMDVLGKTIVAHMEANAYAHRIAKAGQKGMKFATAAARRADYAARKAEALEKGGRAWKEAIADAMEAGFQTPLDEGRKPTNMVDKFERRIAGTLEKLDALFRKEGSTHRGVIVDGVMTLAKLILFPFVKTPYNIVRVGLRKTPLGLPAFALRVFEAGLMKLMKNKQFSDTYGQFFNHMAEQVLAWGAFMLMGAITEGDDDDDQKELLFVGGPLPGRYDREENAARLLQYGENYMLRIGNREDGFKVPFSRYEPIATTLGTTIDVLRSLRKMDPDVETSERANRVLAGLMAQAENKTFLKGISDLIGVMRDVSGGTGERTQAYGLNILSTVVPNIVKAPIRQQDENQREWTTAHPFYRFVPSPDFAAPKIDVAGNEVTKEGNKAIRTILPVAADTSKPLPLHLRAVNIYNTGRGGGPFEDGGTWAPAKPSRKLENHPALPPGETIELGATAYRLFSQITQQRIAEYANVTPAEAAKPTKETIERIRSATAKASAAARDILRKMPPAKLREGL
jgi:N12 class adenine-specific DNA methylase